MTMDESRPGLQQQQQLIKPDKHLSYEKDGFINFIKMTYLKAKGYETDKFN